MKPDKTKEVIEERLGKSLDEVFEWIDLEKPLGSASIAQVRLTAAYKMAHVISAAPPCSHSAGEQCTPNANRNNMAEYASQDPLAFHMCDSIHLLYTAAMKHFFPDRCRQ